MADIVTVQKGKKPSEIIHEALPGYRRLIQIDDLRPDAVRKYCPPSPDEVSAEPTDVVIAWDGANAGTSNFGLSGVLGSTLAALHPIRSDVDTGYLGHFVRSKAAFLREKCKGATVPHIDGRVLASLDVPLPPLAKQQRIAHILDRADALRTKRRVGVETLETLEQSIFLEMFGDPATNPKGWPTAPLSSLVRTNDKINYGVVQPGEQVDGGVPLVRVGDLLGGRVVHDRLKRIDPRIEAAYARSRLDGDEILVSCVGTIGVTVLADESVKGFNIARAVARIPLRAGTDRVYLAVQLRTNAIQRYFISELRTVSQPTLNIKQLSEAMVMIPALEMQADFGDRIRALDAVQERQRESLTLFDTLFASLETRGFRAEL
jgi:type I restriction enzyme S subunit